MKTLDFHEVFRVRIAGAAHRQDNFDYAVKHVKETVLSFAEVAGADFSMTDSDWRVEADGPDIVVRGGVDLGEERRTIAARLDPWIAHGDSCDVWDSWEGIAGAPSLVKLCDCGLQRELDR